MFCPGAGSTRNTPVPASSTGDKHYVTERFQKQANGRWAADILIDGQVAGTVVVFYRKVILCEAEGPFSAGRSMPLIRGRGRTRRQRADAHESPGRPARCPQGHPGPSIKPSREANIALRAVLLRLEEEKTRYPNVPIVRQHSEDHHAPLSFELELEVTGRQRSYVTLLRQHLHEIASPFLTQICRSHMQLTPVEIIVSTMVPQRAVDQGNRPFALHLPRNRAAASREHSSQNSDCETRRSTWQPISQASFADTSTPPTGRGRTRPYGSSSDRRPDGFQWTNGRTHRSAFEFREGTLVHWCDGVRSRQPR